MSSVLTKVKSILGFGEYDEEYDEYDDFECWTIEEIWWQIIDYIKFNIK